MADEARHVFKLGKELTPEELESINEARRLEFPEFESSRQPIAPAPGAQSWDEQFFLLKDDDDNLLAFARLRDVDVEFMRETVPILGVVTVVSLIKGHGYGRRLMARMGAYVIQSGKTMIGFCDRSTGVFYAKCGFGILHDGSPRFVPRDRHGRLDPPGTVDEVFYLEGRDRLVTRLRIEPGENVVLPGPQW